MALPVNIEDLLNKRKVEGNRIEFKRGWNPDFDAVKTNQPGHKKDPSLAQKNPSSLKKDPSLAQKDPSTLKKDTNSLKKDPSLAQVGVKFNPDSKQVVDLIKSMGADFMTMNEMMLACGLNSRKRFRENYVTPALNEGAIERKFPDVPKHPRQRYRLTAKALGWLQSKLQ